MRVDALVIELSVFAYVPLLLLALDPLFPRSMCGCLF
jgi:hypothetical protein